MKDLKENKRKKREPFVTLMDLFLFLTSGVITSCRSVCLISLFIRETDPSTVKFKIVDDRDHD